MNNVSGESESNEGKSETNFGISSGRQSNAESNTESSMAAADGISTDGLSQQSTDRVEFDGTEAFFAVFTQTQVVLSGVRLTIDERIHQQVSDLGAQIETARRSFIHSCDVTAAILDVGRIASSYRQRVQSWEAVARQRESSNNRMSGANRAKMRAEHTRVRGQASLGARALTKLEVELHQVAGQELINPGAFGQKSRAVSKAMDSAQDSKAAVMHGASENSDETNEPNFSVDIPKTFTNTEIKTAKKSLTAFFDQTIGDRGLIVSMANANRKVEGDEQSKDGEQAWDSKLPLMMIAGWSTRHNQLGGQGENNLDLILGKSGVGAKQLDFRFWLVPKTIQAASWLEALDGKLELCADGRTLDSAPVIFHAAEEDDLPRSSDLKKFIQRIESLRFANSDQKFTKLIGRLNGLEFVERSIRLSYG